MSGHSTSHYTKIYFILLVLFVISVIFPEMFPDSKIIVGLTAFGIAFVKAFMVVAYFMHLNVEKKFVWYMLLTCLGFMYLMYIALKPDIERKEGLHWKSNIVVEVPEGHGHHGDEDKEHHGEAKH